MKSRSQAREASHEGLSHRILALQKSLSLRVGAMATSVLHGTHRSSLPGRGMEVDGVREYQPGDEPNRIDWRVSARRGRIHVKEFSAERNLPTAIVLHRSPTLAARPSSAKTVRALELCALLSAVAAARGDRISLIVSPAAPSSLRPLRSGRGRLDLILRRLLEEDWANPDRSMAETLARVAGFLQERSRVYLVSDFQLGEPSRGELRHGLLRLMGRHDLIPVHVTDRQEGHLPSGVSCRWVDPVSGASVRAGLGAKDQGIQEALARHQVTIQGLFASLDLHGWIVDAHDDLASRLRTLFAQWGHRRFRGGRSGPRTGGKIPLRGGRAG